MRRAHEPDPRDGAAAVELGDEQPGDEEAGDDEEDVDADEAAAHRQAGVVGEHGEDGDRPQPLDVGAEAGAATLAARRRGPYGRLRPGAWARRRARTASGRVVRARARRQRSALRRATRASRTSSGHEAGHVAAPARDLLHQRARDVLEGRVAGQEEGLDAGEVAVHQRHRPLVGDVGGAAHALDDDVGLQLTADVDEQPLGEGLRRAPGRPALARPAPARRSRSARRR